MGGKTDVVKCRIKEAAGAPSGILVSCRKKIWGLPDLATCSS